MRTDLALLMLLAAGIGGAQPAPARYTQLVVAPVEVPYGTVMPAEYRLALHAQLTEQLPLKLQSVDVTSDAKPRGGEHVLKLLMVVTAFTSPGRDPRSGAFGLGATSLKIRARVIDATTCALIADGTAGGNDIDGDAAGDPIAAAHEVARDVAQIANRAIVHPPVSASSRCDPEDGVTAVTGTSAASPSAVKKLMSEAAANDAAAQTELAVRYEMGWGVPIDIIASTNWLLKAVAQRHPNTLAVIGVRYEQGLGVGRDLQEAIKYYRAAAEAGHARAMCYLGDMYFGGIGVPPNHVDAYRWHVAAIAAGDERCDAHARASSKSLSREMRARTEREGRELARRRPR
jgi:TPR repeat protein